jgi:hypothetical protein
MPIHAIRGAIDYPCRRWAIVIACFFLAAEQGEAAPRPARHDRNSPRVFLIDPQALTQTKRRAAAGDSQLAAALGRLERDAEKSLKVEPFSVTRTDKIPPSGDKHDYLSLAKYYWPNPNSPSGLPYVVRDGETNPDTQKFPARLALEGVCHHVPTLALAYYLTGREPYAARAAKLLRVFFLDPATRMNPNLEYAQFIPGKNTGRGTGIIDTTGLAPLIDAVGMLAGSPAWTAADQKGMEAWFHAYLRWLLTSKAGQTEGKASNNHGCWYDVQTASMALFAGETGIARQILGTAVPRRIALQIEPDGQMPRELKRTKSFSYCIFNLRALFDLAALGDRVGVDLWNARTPDGRGIRKALDFMLPYTVGGRPWMGQQITKFDPDEIIPLLRRAALAYHDPQYEAMIAKLPDSAGPANRLNLLYPSSQSSQK